MKIALTPKESEEMFYNALCNGLDYMSGYGLDLEYDSDDYTQAKETLKKTDGASICYEDVLMQMLREGKQLHFIDLENDGEMNSTITLNEVHERVQMAPAKHLIDMSEENDDAITADVILQTVFYTEIIFG